MLSTEKSETFCRWQSAVSGQGHVAGLRIYKGVQVPKKDGAVETTRREKSAIR